jgi:hypothetical protein
MKATKKELSGEEETRLSEELMLPALDAQLFMAREFFLRCFASVSLPSSRRICIVRTRDC